MSLFARALLLIALLGSACSQVTFLAPDAEAILGNWIQAYSSKLLNTTYEKHGYCVQAYVSNKRGKTIVTVGLNLFSPTGISVVATDQVRPNADNSLSLSADSSVKFGLIALSPISADTSKYTWASKFIFYTFCTLYWLIILTTDEVLSNEEKSFIMILVRDIDTFSTNGDKELALKFALDNGFNTATNSPVLSFQSKTECRYFPTEDE